MVANIVIGLLIASYSAYIVLRMVKPKKGGSHCAGCAGSCMSCNKCSSEYIDKLIQEAEKKEMKLHG